MTAGGAGRVRLRGCRGCPPLLRVGLAGSAQGPGRGDGQPGVAPRPLRGGGRPGIAGPLRFRPPAEGEAMRGMHLPAAPAPQFCREQVKRGADSGHSEIGFADGLPAAAAASGGSAAPGHAGAAATARGPLPVLFAPGTRVHAEVARHGGPGAERALLHARNRPLHRPPAPRIGRRRPSRQRPRQGRNTPFADRLRAGAQASSRLTERWRES